MCSGYAPDRAAHSSSRAVCRAGAWLLRQRQLSSVAWPFIPPVIYEHRRQVGAGNRLPATHHLLLLLGRLLLDTDRLALAATAGARIRTRALATHRHSLAVPQATIAGDIHQAL